MQARQRAATGRDPLVARARDLLRQTTAVTLADGTRVAVDDSALANSLDTSDARLDGAIEDLATLAALADGPPVDAAAADARLRGLVGEHRARDAEVSFAELVGRALAGWLASIGAQPPDARIAVVALGGTGLAVIALVLAVMGRDIRERFRREIVPPALAAARGEDPGAHLRAADEALRAGDVRAAIRALYLYVVATLATREALRYDPSLTDRELLARARALPHADALRDLVALHELTWYGLRDARAEDATRARSLALEAVA